MLISIALLGYGAVGKAVHRKLKDIPGYGVDFRIHVIQVTNVSKHKVDRTPENWLVVADGTLGTAEQTTIGDDTEWLKGSEGHDTVIDCTSYSEESKELVLALLRRGYWLHTCSKELVSAHWEELLDICQAVPGANICFNSIPASKTMEKFMDVDITDINFEDYKDLDLYSYRGANADITAEYIVRDILLELEKRKINNGNSDINSPALRWGKKYTKDLIGKKLLGPKDEDNIPPEPSNTYRTNYDGYRSNDFLVGTELVSAGCSFTYGSGVPEETIWANVVANSLNVSGSVLARPGASIFSIVEDLFRYFRTYGHPKTVLCLFPDLERLEVPCDGKIIVSPRDNPVVDTVHIMHDDDANRRKYIKKPFNMHQVTTKDMAIYHSVRSIRMLEQYCNQVNIRLIWGTWNKEFNNLAIEMNKYKDRKFDNFFNFLDSNCYSYKKSYSKEKIEIFSNFKTYDFCISSHKNVDCNCSNCHDELLQKYGYEQFNMGMDHLVVGVDHAHPGVHMHAHYAESFLAQIKKQTPKN
jgi:hypothetical protein